MCYRETRMRDPQAGIRALGIGRTEASMLPTLVALSGEGGVDQPPVTEVSGDDKAGAHRGSHVQSGSGAVLTQPQRLPALRGP